MINVLWLVARNVDGQKRELLQFLWDHGACDAEHAIGLSGADLNPSILRSLVSRNVVKQTATGLYYFDPSRVNEAYGASNRFILCALAATLIGLFVIMIW